MDSIALSVGGFSFVPKSVAHQLSTGPTATVGFYLLATLVTASYFGERFPLTCSATALPTVVICLREV